MTKSNRLRRLTAILAVSAMSAGAIGLAPKLPAFTPVDTALAEPVRVVSPQTPDFADVVEAVSPAVVSVRVESDLKETGERRFRFDRRHSWDNDRIPPQMRDHPFFRDGPWGHDDDRGYRRRDGDREYGRGFERRRERMPRRYGMSQGSGFFVSEDGYLVTNHHVIENGSKFTVIMEDGTEHDAKLIGADSRTDLAVLKVESEETFKYVKFSEEEVRVGQWVVAVGNPFGLGGTVTAGIVSAHNRAIRTNRYDDLIQIDAAVNKGNSGGPAFNLNGEVIGVNNVIFSPNGGNVGIAFAIPAAAASQVVEELIENGQVVRGWLGVRIQPVTADIAESVGLDEAGGAIVTEPQDDSPARKAGIQAGDVILAVDGEEVANPRELARKIAGYSPESKVRVSIWRNGEAEEIEVTLGELESERVAARTQDRGGDAEDLPAIRAGLLLEPGRDGVVVVDVEPGSGADEKGVQRGDVVLSVNGVDVRDPADVRKVVREAGELDRKAALFQIKRQGEVLFVAIPLKRG